MVTTQGILAIVGIIFMTAGVILNYLDREFQAAWLLAVGFTAASLWGILTMLFNFLNEQGGSQGPTAALTSIAIVFTLFFLKKAITKEQVL